MTGIGRGVIGIAVAVGLAVGLGGGVPGAGAQGAPPIRVGFSSAMTGPSAITGEGVKWAAQMLADEYNAKGGIAGRKIELYFGDNAGTPGEAVSAVRKLVDVDKVDVIVGQTHSGACLGALPVVKELQVPMVIEACSNPKIRDLIGKNGNEWAFRVNPDDVRRMGSGWPGTGRPRPPRAASRGTRSGRAGLMPRAGRAADVPRRRSVRPGRGGRPRPGAPSSSARRRCPPAASMARSRRRGRR